jgi:hypothetical protein
VQESVAFSDPNSALSFCAACPFESWNEVPVAAGVAAVADAGAIELPNTAVEEMVNEATVADGAAADDVSRTEDLDAELDAEIVAFPAGAPEAFELVTSVLSWAPSGTGLLSAGHEPGGVTAATPSGRLPV